MSEEAGLDIDFDAELAGIQGAAAGVDPPQAAEVEVAGTVVTSARTVELNGRRFRIADSVGLMPLLKFSAFTDVDVSDPRALGAMYAMLKDCIHPGHPGCGKCEDCTEGSERACPAFDPGDWHKFEDWACESKADADDLMDVVTKTVELVSGRPTGPPSPSSPGRRSTRDASMARSSARARKGSRR
jgi:hypothetical protein